LYYYAEMRFTSHETNDPVKRMSERANERTSDRPGQRAASREVRYVNYPIAGLVARRARVRPTSRPYDPNTPRKRSFCPLSISLLRNPSSRSHAPLYTRPVRRLLLTTAACFAPPPLVRFLASKVNLIERSTEPTIRGVSRCVRVENKRREWREPSVSRARCLRISN